MDDSDDYEYDYGSDADLSQSDGDGDLEFNSSAELDGKSRKVIFRTRYDGFFNLSPLLLRPGTPHASSRRNQVARGICLGERGGCSLTGAPRLAHSCTHCRGG